MPPKVSIITITYNAGEFLEKTILSVLNQTSSDLEYVLVDGASTDNTTTIIRKYEDLVSKARFAIGSDQFRWISEADQGLYDAMNKGLRMARGEFVWFINAGDKIYDNNSLALLLKKLEDCPQSDVLYGQSLIIDQYDKALGERHKTAPAKLNKRSLLKGLVVCHQSILVRRTLAPEYDLQYRISADYDWVCKVLSVSGQNTYIDSYISRFMVSGLSARQRKKSLQERFRIMRRHFGTVTTLGAHFLLALRYPFTRKYN